MDNDPELRKQILKTIAQKANLQQKIFETTSSVFYNLKETLNELSSEFNDELEDLIDRRVRIEYRDRGKFEAQIQVAEELLIFSMQTNIFQFEEGHPIWQNPYVQQDRNNAFCGIINIYNFLTDSFKYNRNGDEGYLVGRIFVNHEHKYFLEGKPQGCVKREQFGEQLIDNEALLNILQSTINYVLGFDLYVPPYEVVKLVCVEQFNTKQEHSRLTTGKRLGYDFKVDDL